MLDKLQDSISTVQDQMSSAVASLGSRLSNLEQQTVDYSVVRNSSFEFQLFSSSIWNKDYEIQKRIGSFTHLARSNKSNVSSLILMTRKLGARGKRR